MMMNQRANTVVLLLALVLVALCVTQAASKPAKPNKPDTVEKSEKSENYSKSLSKYHEDQGDHGYQNKAERNAAKEQAEAYKDLFKYLSSGTVRPFCIHGECQALKHAKQDSSSSSHGRHNKHKDNINCQCQPGYTGALCDEDVDECAVSPCAHGECLNLENSYRCFCEPGYTGRDCDEVTCNLNPCLNNGACSLTADNDFECSCLKPWTDKRCERNLCDPTPCENKGTCSANKPGDDFICTCVAPWEGTKCNVRCSDPNPCGGAGQGSCAVDDTGLDFVCTCQNTWIGDLCDVDVCEGVTCSQHGDCGILDEKFVCACISGWEGRFCERDIDECDSNPCGQGTCYNTEGSYTCDCNAGYEFNDGTCKDIDECLTKCLSSGNQVCTNTIGSFQCECSYGFIGDSDNCVDVCENIWCTYNGACASGDKYYVCYCNEGWTGRDCETDINECAKSNPCGPGDCINKDGEYECKCDSGYRFNGDKCIDVDECFDGSHTCTSDEENEQCRNTVGSFYCECAEQYGREDDGDCVDLCKVEGFPCVHGVCEISGHRSCSNKKYFTCRCNPGYSGTHCETDDSKLCVPNKYTN